MLAILVLVYSLQSSNDASPLKLPIDIVILFLLIVVITLLTKAVCIHSVIRIVFRFRSRKTEPGVNNLKEIKN